MTGTTLDIKALMNPDKLAVEIANTWANWFSLSINQRTEWEEARKFVYATDTTKTSASKLPWKNTTTIPKLCQISDNLYAQYMAALFPKRKWMTWEAGDEQSGQKKKRDAILNYMNWVVSQPMFKESVGKLVQDYIQYGNCFAMPGWYDGRAADENATVLRSGYVGPILKRISPFDIVFNPAASAFVDSPKIVRSLISMGELHRTLHSLTTSENHVEMKALATYLMTYRQEIKNAGVMDCKALDEYYRVDGFTSYRSYVDSDYVELLTFYGDMYDYEKKELLQNYQITVVDRHKLLGKRPNPSYFGKPPIFHAGWRVRPDNLWAMGPLANLVGMQYRVDHVENLKADVFDLIAFPVLVEKGLVEDYDWKPMERIRIAEDGDVTMLAPPFQVLQANIEIEKYMERMELMAGAPREAVGFRTPGEKTAFEVQRLENAGARLGQSKIVQFEEQFEERCLNAMLEMAKRMISGPIAINVFDNEFKFQDFMTLSTDDITGAGRLKPIAARHFAERAELIQNLTTVLTGLAEKDQMLSMHFSSVQIAKMLEEVLDLQDYKVVLPFVRVTEKAEFDRMSAAAQEQTMSSVAQPSGLTPDDHELPEMSSAMQQPGPETAPPE